MTEDVAIKRRPEIRVAAVRHIGPYHGIGEAFTKLDGIVRAAGLARPDSELIGIYYDDVRSTPIERLRSDAAISVGASDPIPAGVTEQRLPAGEYAASVHIGPYEQLGGAWGRLREWLVTSGRQLGNGPSYEVYLNTPMTERDPKKLKTALYLPVTIPNSHS